MTDKKYPLALGTCVRTTREDVSTRGSWSDIAVRERRWGVVGTVIGHGDGHGPAYKVGHTGGGAGWYAPTELEVVKSAAGLPDMGFKSVVDQIIAERGQAKTITIIIHVEARKEVIDAFAGSATSAKGNLTELGFAFRLLCASARDGKVQWCKPVSAFEGQDFK